MTGNLSSKTRRITDRHGRTRKPGRPAVYYVLSSEQFPPPDLLAYGEASERAGFDGVWTSDHFQPWQPNEGHSGSAWVTLAALSQRTSKIRFGTGVTCPTFRYRPAVVAQAWASMSLLAPGRLYLGVGAGENLNEGAAGGGWASYGERASRLVEAVRIIRALWTGEHVRIKGRFWDVDGRLYDPPASPIPLYIAAGGPKSARLAGRHGDGLITGAENLKKDPALKAAWEEGVREGGKDAGEEAVIVEHWAIVGGEKEARQAASKWRFMPNAWKPGFFDNVSPADIQTRAEKEVALETVLQEWTVSTDPRDHANAIDELADLGATHVAVHVATPDQPKVIDFFGRKVLPALKRAADS
jgi:TAT-translocated FGD2 family F420-dependent dehydrogenase